MCSVIVIVPRDEDEGNVSLVPSTRKQKSIRNWCEVFNALSCHCVPVSDFVLPGFVLFFFFFKSLRASLSLTVK